MISYCKPQASNSCLPVPLRLQTKLNIILLSQRNVFQAVILTDQSESYSVFNYHNITWIGSVGMGCDAATGRGTVPTCKPAQVG